MGKVTASRLEKWQETGFSARELNTDWKTASNAQKKSIGSNKREIRDSRQQHKKLKKKGQDHHTGLGGGSVRCKRSLSVGQVACHDAALCCTKRVRESDKSRRASCRCALTRGMHSMSVCLCVSVCKNYELLLLFHRWRFARAESSLGRQRRRRRRHTS